MVDDNIYMFPRAIGPMLIDYYSRLMKEPLPQQLKDYLAMLAEATGSVDLGDPADPEARQAREQAGEQVRESVPEKSE
jgi:hypothetical protein